MPPEGTGGRMTVTILRDVLIARHRVEDYFDGTVPTTLWRAFDTRNKGRHPMDIVEEGYYLSNGKFREADITIKPVKGEPWVFIEHFPRGASSFDKPKVFKSRAWEYFRIPAGTRLPEGLAVVKDRYNEVYGATHYTLAPARDMKLAEFKLLLKILFTEMKKEVG